MAYWLVRAENQKQEDEHTIKVQKEKIVHRDRCRFEKVIKVNAEGFRLESAKTAFGGRADQFTGDKGKQRWKSMIDKGITTALLFFSVTGREELDRRKQETERQLAAPVDYVLVPSISSKKVTPAFIHYVIIKKYPVIEIYFSSLQECLLVPWDWIKQAVGPSSISFIFRFPAPETLKEAKWKKKWEEKLAALFPVIPFHNGPVLNKNEMQMAGLFPEKGSLVRGDADYLLYYTSEQSKQNDEQQVLAERSPDIVVMRGNVLKAGTSYRLSGDAGNCCNQIFPGRFRSIYYTGEQRR